MNDFAIEIYTTPTCPDCKAAKEFLSQHNFNYTEHDIVENQENIEELIKFTGKHIVPTIKINDEVFIGFSQNRETIETLLLS